MKQDYADWLTPERLEVEEQLWRQRGFYLRYASAIRRMIDSYPIATVLEFGAGTGWIPGALSDLPIATYVLVDRNPGCLAIARERHLTRGWVIVVDEEIRQLRPVADLVCGFAVLKHFRIDELEELIIRLFNSAHYGLFTIPIAAECIEDGTEGFTHTRVTEAFLARTLAQGRMRELWRDNTDPEEPLIAVERI